MLEYSKYLAVLLGLLLGCPLVWRQKEKLGLKNAGQVLLLCVCFSACSVISAMLFAGLESLLSGSGFSLGAISTYGVYFICPLFLLLVAKLAGGDGKSWLDVFALYAMPSLFLLRINCLISGCCGGRAIGATGFYWPTRQAEMVFYVVMLLMLLRREKRGAPRGSGFPLLMAAYGAFRFVEEWFREVSGGTPLHLAHGWSVAACIIGLGFYFELSKDLRRGKPRRERSASK